VAGLGRDDNKSAKALRQSPAIPLAGLTFFYEVGSRERRCSPRIELYEALYPETAQGTAGAVGKHGAVANLASADKPDRFTADTAAKTGKVVRREDYSSGLSFSV